MDEATPTSCSPPFSDVANVTPGPSEEEKEEEEEEEKEEPPSMKEVIKSPTMQNTAILKTVRHLEMEGSWYN